jgi:putative membrane protein
MTIRWIAAALHLLALLIGAAAIAVRAAGLRNVADDRRLATIFRADSLWGLAAALWISTGLWRLFSDFEKGSRYYLSSNAFWIKMLLLLAILVLEIRPMLTLMRWRIAQRQGHTIDFGAARGLARISVIQLILLAGMVLMATAMARGVYA